ncbi:hypothetical protein NIIDMKKI_15040 [Mycobacterium kansasii]|uniref:Uncharacterized protein n=1 Tax=Mycobacterium kansasii TaxID=1768 RepID=A0A7G1ICW7_MYCKA|nr:hypothetical protein NIIDMKKI_15040 [Mycobacterium kansasii]
MIIPQSWRPRGAAEVAVVESVAVEFLGAAQGAAKAIEFKLAGGELSGRLTVVTSLSKRAGVASDHPPKHRCRSLFGRAWTQPRQTVGSPHT